LDCSSSRPTVDVDGRITIQPCRPAARGALVLRRCWNEDVYEPVLVSKRAAPAASTGWCGSSTYLRAMTRPSRPPDAVRL